MIGAHCNTRIDLDPILASLCVVFSCLVMKNRKFLNKLDATQCMHAVLYHIVNQAAYICMHLMFAYQLGTRLVCVHAFYPLHERFVALWLARLSLSVPNKTMHHDFCLPLMNIHV